MFNIAIISAKKWVNGNIENCIFVGSQHSDNYIYFNDELFYRVLPDKTGQQINLPGKNYWVNTDMLIIDNILSFNAGQAQNVIHGAGGVAPNADVETAVQWAIEKATSGTVTYSQGTRNLKNPDGNSYDCSSFVITTFYVGGFDANAFDTTTMRAAFLALGFTWIPGSYFEASDLIRGDIQLNELAGNDGHTNIYIGNNQDVDCGGSNLRIIQHTPDDFGNGWHGILRYEH